MATNDGWYPDAKPLPLTTGESSAVRADVARVSICDHITDGTDSRNHLQNVANDASVHFLIRVEGGKAIVYQFLSIFRVAWGNGRTSGASNPYMPQWIKDLLGRGISPNYATISIEHEGKYPQALPFPDVMIEASIKLHKWIADQIPTIKRDRAHIIGHYQIDHIDRAFCPGGAGGTLFPFERIVSALNTPTPTPISPLITIPAFQDFYLKEPNARAYFGIPLEASKQEKLSDGNTYTVQYFERARFELHGDKVLLGLIGAELLAKPKGTFVGFTAPQPFTFTED